jgi:hypothetical protein
MAAPLAPEAAGELAHLLQTSISPYRLISGVGLLLLSMTNRLSRVIDRSRSLSAQLRAGATDAHAAGERSQLRVLAKRARLLWIAIASVMVTVCAPARWCCCSPPWRSCRSTCASRW